ncbi:MAG: molybdopterin dinucleotide binding domain-containing protein, partial [Thermotaleaceae bacterium]
NPFPTPSGKIEIFSERLFRMNQPEDIPAIPKYVPSFEGAEDPLREKYPLQLIGWHSKRRTHSTHDNNENMDKIHRQRIWINEKDAQRRGIQDGDLVELWNDRGRVRIPAYVTTRIIEGVAALSQGAWYTPDTEGVDHRGSINVLTTSRPTPLAKGNPQHTNLVEIKLVE